MTNDPTRRRFLRDTAAVAATVPLLGCGDDSSRRKPAGAGDVMDPGGNGTCRVTDPDILGPYYKAGAPVRSSIAAVDEPGRRMLISGRVLTADCQPVEGALVDVWQANDRGAYDNSDDYILRGRVYTDAAGQYGFETILPGNYSTRPRHIHYRVVAGQTELVTQLYFSGDPFLATDPWADPARTIDLTEDPAGLQGTFDITV